MQMLTLRQPPSTNPKQTSMIPLPRQYHSAIRHLQVAPNRPTVNPPPNKNLGIKLRVAYQGVPGAFSEAATKKAYPDCELIACNQFDHVCKAVETWSADHAVLPLENSTGGSVHTNYDLLLSHRGLHIVGEVNLAVHHCLVALPGVEMKSIWRVISHAQALAQCNNTVTSMGVTLTREPVANTAWAAEHVAKNCLRDTAAIASTRAAELYGLNVLADGIQDDPRNVTRFVALAREPHAPSISYGPNYKTSIVFASNKGASSLFKILSSFALRDINVTKIETRPRRSKHRRVDSMGEQFEYVFYIDLEASLAEARTQDALDEVKKMTSFFRVLGSYPMDMSSWSPARGNKRWDGPGQAECGPVP